MIPRILRRQTSPEHIPQLDGWRVLLVFLVSWYHIWQQSWLTPRIGTCSLDFLVRAGYLPVDGTILLSGFLLFLPYARAMREGKPDPSTRGFFRRRFMRIWPSYMFFTLLMLFVMALPEEAYYSTGDMWKDLAAHFTFTFTFFRQTYLSTPLGAASWTLCVEVQMYVIFPWIARKAMKHPGAVILGLCAAGAYYRMWAIWRFSEYSMVLNQLASFLDVYGIGMALAILYLWLKAKYEAMDSRGRKLLLQTCATVCFFLAMWGLTNLFRHQAGSGSYPDIQRGQMLRRMPMTLMMGICMLSLPFSLAPLRYLFGNPLTRFLGGISMNYYLIHHPVAVFLKRIHVPYSPYDLPNQAGDRDWMLPYTWLCFGISLSMAVLMTYLVEKPAAFGLRRLFAGIDRRRAARKQSPQIHNETEIIADDQADTSGKSSEA